MSSARALLDHCRALGLILRPRGAQLSVRPADQATPELLAEIRAAKVALLCLLEAEALQLPLDCAPWLHVAVQVMAGEFDGGDRSMIESLVIGLRNVPHPRCQSAKARLETLLSHQKEVRK